MTDQIGDNESSVRLIPPAIQLRDYEAGPVDGQRRRKIETLLIEEPVNTYYGQTSSNRRNSTTDRSTRASLLRLWWAELMAASFSLACIIVQAGLLRMLDDKPFGTWRLIRTDVNPNTLISILATLNRSSLLLYVTQGIAQLKWPYFQRQSHRLSDVQVFDDASRGPLGSLYLLWSLNIKATVACLGAVIVVLALFVEPFSQQIMAPHPIPATASNETASIAATNIYVADYRSGGQVPMLGYQVTILSALTLPATDPPYDCPSGNCTWSEYSSLGICNSCEDIAHEALVSCDSFQGDYSGLCTYKIPSSVGEDDLLWTLWAPSVQHFLNGTQQTTKEYWPTTWWNTTVKGTTLERKSSSLANITNFTIHMPGSSNYTSLAEAYSVLPTITRCSMTWCKQTYITSHVENGTLHDRAASKVPIYINPRIFNSTTQMYAAWVGEQAVSDAVLQSWLDEPAAAPDHAYSIDTIFPDSVPSILADVLSFTYFYPGSTRLSTDGLTNTTDQVNTLNALLSTTTNAEGNTIGWSQEVFVDHDGSNISAKLDNVAVALTNLIRRSANSSSVQGDVHRTTIRIRIRWPWFIYPASITALSIIFLALVITLSHRKGELVWKASSTALAFHGLRSGEDSEVNLVDVLKIRDTAETKWVKLAADDDGRLALRTS
ncbi:hypothetical protein LTR17_000743 [Elasticomyces elasticus]|nr:hypothetical protein LTR17_000743 [Elasticomyces elasticus]